MVIICVDSLQLRDKDLLPSLQHLDQVNIIPDFSQNNDEMRLHFSERVHVWTVVFAPGWNDKCGSWAADPFNDFCYLFNFISMRTWSEARADCVNQGGDLVSITDPFEQAFIQGIELYCRLRSPDAWYVTFLLLSLLFCWVWHTLHKN